MASHVRHREGLVSGESDGAGRGTPGSDRDEDGETRRRCRCRTARQCSLEVEGTASGRLALEGVGGDTRCGRECLVFGGPRGNKSEDDAKQRQVRKFSVAFTGPPGLLWHCRRGAKPQPS